MIVMGIDYGDRRIGLAVSDPRAIVAHGLPTIENISLEETMAVLRDIVAEREVDDIVVGLPLNMDGSEGEQAQKVRVFAGAVAVLGKPVHFVDERLTSERAERVMKEAGLSYAKRRKRVDRLAAQFILQAFLDRRPPQT